MSSPRLRGLLALFLVISLGTLARVQGGVRSTHFGREDPNGMLVTDPGLLFYLTRRTVEAGGLPPDLRADPRLEHPGEVDVLARFTYGQELLVLVARSVVGPDVPLHMLCVWVFALVMALAAVPIYGLAHELTRSHGWAAGAALWYALLPATHRTLGFVLMREDLALPLFALHLWLAARAARVRTPLAGALAGAALGLALGTWHAMGGVVLLEALALLAALAFWKHRPLTTRAGLAGLVTLSAACLLIPALFAKGAVLSPALALGWGLALAGRFKSRARGMGAAFGCAAALIVLGFGLSRWLGTSADLRHVAQVMVAKLTHLGLRPGDPNQLSFEARMMWQGPFATLTPAALWSGFQFGLPALAVMLLPRGRSALERALLLGLVLSAGAAWMVSRLVVIPGLLLPVLLARAAQCSTGRDSTGQRSTGSGSPDSGHSIWAALGFGGLTFLQLIAFGSWLGADRGWYREVVPSEVAAAVAAVEQHVPPGQAVATDFMLSTALLAQSDRPLVLSPKWETAGSRERVRRFWQALYHQGPERLRALIREEWSTHWLLIDRRTLWLNPDARYLAGLRADQDARPGTAAQALLGQRPGEAPEGYGLVWSGPDPERPRFRLYALD